MPAERHPTEWGYLPDIDFGLTDLLDDVSPEDWTKRALCAQTDPESFFPDVGESTSAAKRICQLCEVRDECLQYALDNNEKFGVWGGLSEPQRFKLKKYGEIPRVSPKVARREKRDEKIRALRSQGLSTPEVAALMGVGERTVIRAMASSSNERTAA